MLLVAMFFHPYLLPLRFGKHRIFRNINHYVMKAIFFEKPGGLDVLKYGDFPTPEPRQGEALVRVKACALNRLDVWLREDVVLNPATPCGSCPRCKKGEPCELVKIFGVKNQCGYAEYVTAPITQLYPKPKNISFVEAAAFPLTFLTA